MEHRFSIPNILTSYLGSKGIFYSGIFLNKTGRSRAQGGDYEVPEGIGVTAETDNAIPLRAEDVLGSHYFMPVWLQPSGGERVEIPNAVISMTGRKNRSSIFSQGFIIYPQKGATSYRAIQKPPLLQRMGK